MQANNKIGQKVFGRKRGLKELDGMFHAKRPSTKRKRAAHKKSIETKVRQETKRLCRKENYND